MATLALSTAGAALGSAFLPSFSALGASVTGAAIGQAAGALAGRFIDQALFAPSGQDRVVEGPRLDDLQVLSSSEGAPIPRLYGRAKLGGQVIWGPPFEEKAVTSSSGSGGGGKSTGGGSGGGSRVDYLYFANFAVGICEGPISRLGRIWADGKELDLSGVTYRVYNGTEAQVSDSLIVGIEGAGRAPAYRGLAYVVFERLPLARFGNRLPQLAFEVFLPLDGFERDIRAVTVIPGAGEFAYDTQEVVRQVGGGTSFAENTHTGQGTTDWSHSIDQLEASATGLKHASLVVSWFGTDLRAGSCTLRPGVERADKVTTPHAWMVQGIGRSQAHVVSQVDGRPAYGGTPTDQSVIAAIKDLSARGIGATFYPFILMDVATGNALPDPYGAAAQAAYPWRGRITVHPAAGQSGSLDGTAQAAMDIAAFVGTAAVGDFSVVGETVSYNGPAEWSYRRMILHYAHLCKAAGGVDAFLIGSEMRGLSTVRDAAGGYPFVAALEQLANDVKAILGAATKVTYGADWSEYFGHQPDDGSGDVTFHLDPLWASASIDAIGIDLYWPLSDWRAENGHLDQMAGTPSIYDLDYLRTNIAGGEGYDWYYASDAERTAQTRTPITDGLGKPWVYRYKDIFSWWSNQHFDRVGGIEASQPTAWVPQSKPFWFTEVGCPAVDLGANQPNVFVDPKSSESHLPYFSQGRRDDLMQRRYLSAILGYFDPDAAEFVAGNNPVSSVTGQRMVATDRIYLYTWDARPYPVFPAARSVWSDGENWARGHWLTGRLGGLDLSALVARILDDCGFHDHDTSRLIGVVHGLVIDRLMSARQALQPLELAYFFDGFESAATLKFRHRGDGDVVDGLTHDMLVETKPGATLCSVTRAQETDLPVSVKLGFIDESGVYDRGAVESRRLASGSTKVATVQLPLVLEQGQARSISEVWLHDAWQTRETAKVALPPSRLAVEPSDMISIETPSGLERYRMTALTTGTSLEVELRSITPDVFGPVSIDLSGPDDEPTFPVIGPSFGYLMDLPNLTGTDDAPLGWFAASQSSWPGRVDLFRATGAGGDDPSGFEQLASATQPATLGTLAAAAPAQATSRWSYGNDLIVTLQYGQLEGLPELGVLNGGNVAAIRHALGDWEVVQFRNADLVGPATYRLHQVLRGQSGTEHLAALALPSDAPFVLLDKAVVPLSLQTGDLGREFVWTWGASGRSIGHYTYQTEAFAFAGASLLPLAPVHLHRSDVNGDVRYDWIRRTRIGGDSWASVMVPSGEDVEAYEIDIRDGATVVRTLASTVPTVTYSIADQTADWGGAVPTEFDVAIYQISGLRGRGTPLLATL